MMKKLLILNDNILGYGEFSETEDIVIVSGMSFPKHLIQGYITVDLVNPPNNISSENYFWNGSELIPKELPLEKVVPAEVTMRQARLALLQAGKLSSVAGAIELLPSPQKEIAHIEWEFSSEVFRNRPLVQALGPLLGLSEDDLDDLFILAGTL